MRGAAALFWLLLASPALAQEAPVCPFPGQTPKLVVQVFFGQNTAAHALVSRRAWQRFVADTITPALPNGFTIYDAYGQYLDKRTGSIGREATEVLVVAADDTPEFRARVAALTEAYRRRFDQISVGILTSLGCGVF